MEYIHNLLMVFMVITSLFIFLSNSPVYSVLLLILDFCLAAIILIMFEVEFVGLLFIMVYVGAVAVLFLFVIMMINTKKIIVKQLSSIFYFFLIFFCAILFIFINFKLNDIFFNNYSENSIVDSFNSSILKFDNLSNIELIGQSLYNNYNVAVLIAGFVLLIAFIGCICLTIELKKNNTGDKTDKQLSKAAISLNKFN